MRRNECFSSATFQPGLQETGNVRLGAFRHSPRRATLGAGYYASRINKDRKARNHSRQLQALGYTVTLTQAA